MAKYEAQFTQRMQIEADSEQEAAKLARDLVAKAVAEGIDRKYLYVNRVQHPGPHVYKVGISRCDTRDVYVRARSHNKITYGMTHLLAQLYETAPEPGEIFHDIDSITLQENHDHPITFDFHPDE